MPLEKMARVIAEGNNLRFLARETLLQAEQIKQLEDLDIEAEALKDMRIAAQDEDGANALLGIQCLADCQAEELRMWIQLKAGQPEDAWSHLILAQEAFGGVRRATRDIVGDADNEKSRLDILERFLFPPQRYLSIGLLVHGLTCSVCGEDYEKCDHISGRPYWGRFCAMLPQRIEADHTAIVDIPADKRCRIAFVSDGGRKRNRMTWALTEEPMDDRTISGILVAATGRWTRMVFTLEMLHQDPETLLEKPVYGSGER